MKRKLSPLKLVMLVDDDDTTNYLNQRLLESLNAAETIIIKKDGEQAIDYLTKSCAAETAHDFPCPDLILLDIKMPVMDGFEFLDAYKAAKFSFQKDIVILMLTSSASFYDLEKLKIYPEVRQHYSKALLEADIKDMMESYFPDHVTYV